MSPLTLTLLLVAGVFGVLLWLSLTRGRDESAPTAVRERRPAPAPSQPQVEEAPTYAYCPDCGAEYFRDVTHCSDCKVPLTDEPPDRAYDAPLELVRLVESRDPAYLSMVRGALTAAGVEFLADSDSVGYAAEFGGIRVRARDHERAAEVLFELQPDASDFGDEFNSWVPQDDPEVVTAWEEQGGVQEADADLFGLSDGEPL